MRDGAGASLLPCFLGNGDLELVCLLDPPPKLVEDVHLLHERGRRTRSQQLDAARPLRPVLPTSRIDRTGLILGQAAGSERSSDV